ncbi:GNAT family N-acetyltransferase [Trueperella bialowiezensis]|uniref:Ribosomal-protein-alanine N-acetyltransferase n=1 Tax=Trueperella bialowiezensis TaxID=312285 RepID=A0A3S4VF67_9ACTO|nr:GNAT family N-acetyltransferase [Trueperella bialowiezensis]VEI12802.1 ribosomal-protein-alanine N-acetyltransferase [Trueperella bialowiezensis]
MNLPGFELVTPEPESWRAIAAFDRKTFGIDAWPRNMWRHELVATDRSYLALMSEPSPIRGARTLVGMGGITHGPESEVLTIGIAQPFRGRGLGKFLLSRLLEIPRTHRAQAVFLEVRAADDVAQHLYEKAGFRRVGLRKNYYHGDDAVIMKLDLDALGE